MAIMITSPAVNVITDRCDSHAHHPALRSLPPIASSLVRTALRRRRHALRRSQYLDPTPLLAKRQGRERGKAVQVTPTPWVTWAPTGNGQVEQPFPKRKRTRMPEEVKSTLKSQADVELYKTTAAAESLADILP